LTARLQSTVTIYTCDIAIYTSDKYIHKHRQTTPSCTYQI